MRLATIQHSGSSRAVRIDGETCTLLDAADVGAWVAHPGWVERAGESVGESLALTDVELLTPVLRPGKIVCVGLNYRTHILEMGRELPTYPTLFAKYAEAIVGPSDPIMLPPETNAFDWEAELGVVIGATVRRASETDAEAAIAGFTVVNDITLRDWQNRTLQWLQGKTFEGTTPVGPVMVTPDDLPGGVRPSLTMTCSVDGEEMQRADTGDLVFDPVALVRYVSTMVTLRPGDLIATGTPGGVGHARNPQRYLSAGQTVVTEIDRIGRLVNVVQEG